MHYHGGAYKHYDAIQRRVGTAQGLSEGQQASVRAAFRGSSYPFSTVYAPVEEVLDRMVRLLQWLEFLQLGLKFVLPVTFTLAEVQSSSVGWLRPRCVRLGVDEFCRFARVLRWRLSPENFAARQSGALRPSDGIWDAWTYLFFCFYNVEFGTLNLFMNLRFYVFQWPEPASTGLKFFQVCALGGPR